MQYTQYFKLNVMAKRPELDLAWVLETLETPVKTVVQSDGRIRFWRPIPEFGNRVLWVVTLPDGQTVHNAFFDRDFRGG